MGGNVSWFQFSTSGFESFTEKQTVGSVNTVPRQLTFQAQVELRRGCKMLRVTGIPAYYLHMRACTMCP